VSVVDRLPAALGRLGFAVTGTTPLAGDASQRRFFRVGLRDGRTVVAALYPPGGAVQAARDHAVQCWGAERGLPVPAPLGRVDEVTVSADLGDEHLEATLGRDPAGALAEALEALAAYQRCPFETLPTPPFDAAFFRRELVVFEQQAAPEVGAPVGSDFLDRLAERLASHPRRLVHRDFHVNNLLRHAGRVWTVDFQDMRGGPDTYDLVSLLRERAAAGLAFGEARWRETAAARLGWERGWEGRFWECAAQRGLKVLGTFLRLAAAGRPAYLAWVPDVAGKTLEALAVLDAPESLQRAVARLRADTGPAPASV
jgi:aminoglycoside/choline kinase family phosphotransferase